jgi:hypothetical protein
MLRRTHTPDSPWYIVPADDKDLARLNLIRHLLTQLHYWDKRRELLVVDPAIVFTFDEARLSDGTIAR